MQWLIDIAIEAMKQYLLDNPSFVDRGDPAVGDWVLADLIADTAWHELDLTGIVPAGATAVSFNLFLFNTVIAKHVAFRTPGNVNTENEAIENTLVANTPQTTDILVHPDADGKIEYWIDAGGWIAFSLTVKGWWTR